MDGELAALLTSTSMPPNRSTAALTAASASSALVTFSCTTKPLPLFLLLLPRPLIGSGALTLGPLLNQLLDRSGEGGFEVDEFDPRRGDDYPDHAVVERADLGLPLDALLGGHFVAAVHLQVLLRDAVHHVQLRSTADEQDLRRVHLGVDRQGDPGVVPQGGQLRGVLSGTDDDLRAVPGECDRDVAGGAVLGDVGHAEQVASQELLADREVQDRGDLVWLHGGRSFVGVIEAGSAAPSPGTEPPERSRHLRSTNLRIRTSGAHSRPDWSSTSCMCMFLGSVALFASDRRGDMSFAWHRPSRGAGGHHHSSRLSLH